MHYSSIFDPRGPAILDEKTEAKKINPEKFEF
jgi:hypothetical protein